MDALLVALTESLIGMVVTMVLLGLLGGIFYIIGKFETGRSPEKQDEPYVIAAAYQYVNDSQHSQITFDSHPRANH